VYGENSEAPRTHDAEQVLIRNIGLRSAVSAFMVVWGRCGGADVAQLIFKGLQKVTLAEQDSQCWVSAS
jgi:hypothetical protein